MSFAAVESDQVAGMDVAGDAAQARDRGDAQRSGQDGRMAGGAAGLGEDARHMGAIERQRLRRQDFRSDEDDRLVPAQLVFGLLPG